MIYVKLGIIILLTIRQTENLKLHKFRTFKDGRYPKPRGSYPSPELSNNFSDFLPEERHSQRMPPEMTEEIAVNTLALTSKIIAETRQKVLGYIERKAVRRTDERYPPDYYLDQTGRDYFNDYHENWLGISNDSDYEHLLQRINLSEILAKSDVEKEGLQAYFAFSGITELLKYLGQGKAPGYLFNYKDECNTSDCINHLTAYLEVNNPAALSSKQLALPGFNYTDAFVTLPRDLAAHRSSHQLQVQVSPEYVATTELNPFMFDPSIKLLAGPIIQLLILDTKTQLRISTNQLIHLKIPYNFKYYQNNDDINPRRDTRFFGVMVKPIKSLSYTDYPVLKMTLLPKVNLKIVIKTTSPHLKLYTLFTKEIRPEPQLLRDANLTDEPVKLADVTEEIYEYPAIYLVLNSTECEKKTYKLIDYYFAIFPQEDQNFAVGSFVNLSVEVFRANCVYREEDKSIWSERGCWADEVTQDYINCTCPHLSTFSAAILTTPVFMDIADDIRFNISLVYNYIILGIVSSLLLVLVILLIFCHIWSLRDRKNPGLHILADPTLRMEQHFYLITVYTGGLWRRKDTTGNISVQIYGSSGTSLPFVLREETQEMKTMRNNHLDTFLVSNFKGLGELEKIRVWRDDHGKRPDWTCRKIMIQCLRSRKTYIFLVNMKFTLKFYGCGIRHEVYVATEGELLSWRRVFSDFIYEAFQDRHSFLSAIKCSPSIYFSRCQRLMCAGATVALYFVLIYLYREVFVRIDGIEPAEFYLEAKQILVALIIFLLTTPIEIFLRFSFRHSLPRKVISLLVWKSRHLLSTRNAQVFGYFDQSQEHHSELSPVYFNQQGGKLEDATDFYIPEINAQDAEEWLEGTSYPRRFSYSESLPPDLIRPEQISSGSQKKNLDPSSWTNLVRNVNLNNQIQEIRNSLPKSFTYSTKEPNRHKLEDRIQKEVKTKGKILDGKHKKPQDENPKPDQIPHDFTPVKVVEVESLGMNFRQIVQIFLCWHRPINYPVGLMSLPHCFKCIGWIISIFLLLTSLAMAAYLGLRCGPVLRLEIISDFIITFFLSTLIFQPIYLICVAAWKSSFFRVQKNVQDWRFQVIFQKDAPDVSKYVPYEYNPFLPERAHPPLEEVESFQSKLEAVRISHSRRNMIMLIAHALLMSILIFITYTNYSSHDFSQIRSLQGLLCVEECWGEVEDSESFYDYMSDALYKIYPLYSYDGSLLPYFADVPVYLADETSMLVGVPRLHQFRIDPQSTCASPTKFLCLSELFIKFETKDFDPKWLPLGSSSSSFPNNDVWKHNDSRFSKMTIGDVTYYPSGGYMAHLGRDLISSNSVLNYLRRNHWIDGRTRGVFLELATYNPNVNLFVYTKLLAEITGSGEWVTSSVHYPITLTGVSSSAQENYSEYLVILFLLTVLALAGKIVIQIREWVIYRKVTYSEMILVLLTIISLVIGLYRLHLVRKLKIALDLMNINDHIIFDLVCFWDQWQQDMFAVTFSFAVLMILQYIFKTKKEFFMLDVCLKLSSTYLMGHGLLICLLLLSFAMLGYVVFSSVSFPFHSLPSCFITLLQEVVDNNFIYELSEEERFWGQAFEILFTFAVVIVGINLFISILDNGFTDARRIATEKKYWMSYFYFIRKRFQRKLPFRGYPVVHPQRLIAMQLTSATFLRACFQTQELQLKQRMFQATQELLNARGFSLVSNSMKKKRMRAKVKVEKRLEAMRFLVSYLLQMKMTMVLTPSQVKENSKFTSTILKLKLRKLEQKLGLLEEAVGKLRFRERKSSSNIVL